MADDFSDIMHDFVVESQEALDQMEPKLIEMSKTAGIAPVDDQIINSIFRLFHSIKGSAGFLNLINIQKVTHEVETLLDLVRKGDIQINKRHIDLLLKTSDFIRGLLSQVEVQSNDQGVEEEAGKFIIELKEAFAERNSELSEKNPPQSSTEGNTGNKAAETDCNDLPQMLITPEMIANFVKESIELLDNTEQSFLKLEKAPEDVTIIEEVFRGIHSLKGNCGFLGFSDMEQLSHKTEAILECFREKSVVCDSNHIKILLSVLDALRKGLDSLSNNGKEDIQGLTNLLKLLDMVSPSSSGQKPIASPPPKKKVGPGIVKNAPVNQQDIRVNLEKLDTLIELVGELVVSENMVVQNPDLNGHDFRSFEKAAHHLHKITRDLQEMAMSLRMIPVANTFRKMNRLVHDLTQKNGKEIELEIIGEETEVDKTVIELIGDPLVHMIRNAIDHGLETPAERRKAGKNPKGKVTLEARHESGEVWIIIKDDGRGLDKEKILRKAIKLGLANGNSANMTDEEVYMLIFEPGFSTASKITDVSGRGVGMDVVRRNIDKLKGQVDVQSTSGKGTKFTTRIPLTLAIIEGMLVQVGNATYTIPLQNIRESIRTKTSQITVVDGDEVVMISHKLYPILRLHKLHDIKPDYLKLEEGILVMVEHKGQSFCIFVDKLLGQQQTVIKGLSNYVGNVRGVSGCTILGSGDVSLILDVGTLAQLTEKGGKDAHLSTR